MSRWWGDATRAVLLPDRVLLAQLRYRMRPRVLGTMTASVSASPEAEPWRAPLGVLEEALGTLGRKLPVTVVVSNAFVRYALLPWASTVIRGAERDAYARHHLKLRFGDCPIGTRVVASTPGYGQAGIACAMQGELIGEIERAAASAGTKVSAIQPLLMTVFNAYAAEATRRPGVTAIVEPGCASLVFAGAQGLAQVVTRRLTEPWAEELGMLINQELAALGTPFTPERVLLFLADPGEDKLPALDWPIEVLAPATVHGEAATRHAGSLLALCGA